MATTVKEKFAIFNLFLLLLYAQVNQYCHVGILPPFYANFIQHWDAMTSETSEPIFLSQPKMKGNISFCAACVILQKGGRERM